MTGKTMSLDRETVQRFADAYVNKARPKDMADEREIESMISDVRGRGFLSKEQFLLVCRWKTPRIKSHVESNGDAHIEEATRVALATPVEAMRASVLTTLKGVSYPVASVILHWFHTESYPILDFRAVQALGFEEPIRQTPEYWGAYVAFWRGRLHESGETDARIFDRALWQWSKDRSG